jgi:hypothetical protein
METRPRPYIAPIPDPTADVDGLFRSVMALKQAVEQMVGSRGRSHGGLSEKASGHISAERKATIHIVVQAPSAAIDGDFWLCKGQTTSLSVAVNGKWEMIWP